MIKAPFNFVPLPEHTYIPEWHDLVSHDIPFENYVSGTIELNIKAETPIFVRNGHAKNEKDKNFSNIESQYFIPSTSIKGAIRNVLEIITFGKISQVDNSSFGLRDLSRTADGNAYKALMRKVHCGWLRTDGEKAFLTDCGEPDRITVKDIDSLLNTRFEDFITNEDNFRKGKGREAQLKYKSLFTHLSGISDNNNNFRSKFLESDIYLINNNPFINGTLIFTGQPGVRKRQHNKWVGKRSEFIFKNPIETEFEVLPEIFKAFKTIHKNSPDYDEFWKIKLNQGKKIPVFFQYDNLGSLHSIGLSYMYKYPYNSSVYDGIPSEKKNPADKNTKPKLDMAELMFGHTYQEALRGRVQFSHAFINENKGLLPKVSNTLSSPHPSYYPLYLGNGKTWNDIDIKIAGWKRYPPRNHVYQNRGTETTDSHMIPLNKGCTFTAKVRFHNLNRIELGALLSAISFHNHKECYHSIGSAKPLGYGKVKIEYSLAGTLAGNESVFLTEYESHMEGKFENKWFSSATIQELLAMSKGIPDDKDSSFRYMQMSNRPDENEFSKGKVKYDQGARLGTFTQILNGEVPQAIPPVQNQQRVREVQQRELRRNTPRRIDAQEKEYGWKLEIEEEYLSFIKENQEISICPPRGPKKRNIVCKYEVDDYSKIKSVKPDQAVIIEILEKDDSEVIININQIKPPRNNR